MEEEKEEKDVWVHVVCCIHLLCTLLRAFVNLLLPARLMSYVVLIYDCSESLHVNAS